MNEDDLTKTENKEEKVKKTTKAKAKATAKTKVKAEKRTSRKVEAKPQIEPKIKKTVSKAVTAEADIEVQSKVKPKVRKTVVKAKTVANAEAEKEPKAKKTTSKTKETVAVKAETKTKRPRAAKTAEEAELEKLPLVAKIQTQENYDLSDAEAIAEEELSPVFKELAEPKLPALREENRAFLQIQSPTRIFFYWSLKQNSQETLRRALGSRANDYFLAIRLTNLNTSKEEIHRVESKGSWWFNNIEADSKYRAEVGFYAQGRPFVRIVFSNTLETPRQKPSENIAYQPYFAVTADQFAEVLDLAGFSQDAFEVYLAGDEPQFADKATENAFVQLVGTGQVDFSNINIDELRFVLFSLASGVSLFALRDQLSGDLFEFLSALTQENPKALTEEKVILALEEFFGISSLDEEIKEEFGEPTVFGASLINFPKQLKKKTTKFDSPGKVSPLSSFSLK